MAEADLYPREIEAFDASNPSQVKKQQREANRREKERREVVAAILATPAGRNWMWELLSSTHIYESSYVGGDAMAMAFREGERNIGLQVLDLITRTAPDAFIQMTKERGNG